MSINLITGLMGSGKSYEATAKNIVVNYAKGRTIITNMKGLNLENIKAYVLKENPKLQAEDLGEIRIISDKDIMKDNFFPYLTEEDNKEIQHFENSIVKPGDLIIIDEALNFWARGKKVPEKHYEFFRMHRHFVSPKTNLTCDMVVIVQVAKLLNPEVKDLIEMSFNCKKLNSLGLQSHYRVVVYDGNLMTPSNKISNDVHKYNSDIFPLYKSHAGDNAKEVKIDGRTNIFKTKKVLILACLFILLLPACGYKIYTFFNPKQTEAQIAAKQKEIAGVPPNSQTSTNQTPNTGVLAPATTPKFKIVGVLDLPNKRLIYLEDEQRNIKMVYAQLCTGTGLLMTCKIDNQEISYYSNIARSKSLVPLENNKNEKKAF